jgi:MoaA/NifB/PqqE/SkfB family radical SAM enzyme
MERPWQEWASALALALPPGSSVDISGGEPLIYPGIVNLVAALGAAGIRWAITTNGLNERVLDELCRHQPPNCGLILVSAHAQNPGWLSAVERLRRAGFPVDVNRVGHPAAPQVGERHNEITFQNWEDGTALDGIPRICDAGRRHWVADPSGDVYRCQVLLQLGHKPIGNLLDAPLPEVGEWECRVGCSTCYTDHPAAWRVSWREVREAVKA